MTELLVDLFRFVHLVGFALLFGGLVVQFGETGRCPARTTTP
ncbi:MAG: hypothetical protein ACOCZB_00500 [Spirochaetota bacterium]